MEILRFNIHTPVTNQKRISACIGYFDGLHKGHQELIAEVKRIAKETNTTPALITFDPDPWCVIHKLRHISHITPMRHRLEIGATLGIEKWIVLDFDEDMARLSHEQFHELVLGPLNIDTLVCGFDFHYGYRGEGNVETLNQQQAFHVRVIREISSQNEKISSTRIEHLIEDGNMEDAAYMMGRPYELRGIVKSGNRIGRKYGFPTANLQLDADYVLPKMGVYVGSVYVNDAWWMAIINVGHNPSFNYQHNTSIEAFILDFHAMIYDKSVKYQFHHYLRGEKRFENMDALKQQLERDTQSARTYFKDRKGVQICD